MVGAIQETIKDRPNTTISVGTIIKDNNGCPREFDVLVETNVNKEALCIAFECKDYSTSKAKTKVDIKVVDGLIGKCRDIPIINKKIIVSTTGYTRSAIIKAESNGIQLYSLDNIPIENIMSATQVFRMMPKYTVGQEWTYHTMIPENVDLTKIQMEQIIYNEEDDTVWDISLLPDKWLYELPHIMEESKLYMDRGKTAKSKILYLTPQNQVYLKDNQGNKYILSKVAIPVVIDFEIITSPIVARSVLKRGDENISTNTEFVFTNAGVSIVEIESEGINATMYFKDANGLHKPHYELK